MKKLNNFQLYIKNTNKIVIILSLCILVIQSAVPSYEIKKGSTISFIEFNDSKLFRNNKLQYEIYRFM